MNDDYDIFAGLLKGEERVYEQFYDEIGEGDIYDAVKLIFSLMLKSKRELKITEIIFASIFAGMLWAEKETINRIDGAFLHHDHEAEILNKNLDRISEAIRKEQIQ